MKQRFKTLFAGGLLTLTLFGVAAAGPLEDAQAAYLRGDYASAMRLWRPLADQRNAGAQNNLGTVYGHGQGVARDYAEAVKWYRKAADQGLVEAQYNLGMMYYNGRSVPEDYALAYMWLNLAASRAVDTEIRDGAIKARDLVAAKMTPDQIAEAQRMAREWVPKPASP